LDGFCKTDVLARRAKEMGMPAVAITDHGTMYGVIEFYKNCLAAGVKPIIGIETYLAPRRMTDRDSKLDRSPFHLLLLAENMTGYQNLLQIASASQLEGFYYYPRIDHDYLAAHSEGLICTTGCLAAEVPQALMANNMEAARKNLDWYYQVFGPDRFFLEFQDHKIPELEKVNKGLLELGKHYNARNIGTNDVHYIEHEDWRYQDILLAIQTGSLLSDPKRMRMSDDSYYLRSPEEMQQIFGEIPGALENTLAIAERCNVDLAKKGYHLPVFEVPEGYDAQSYLRKLCEEGLDSLYGTHKEEPQVRERLEYELKVIHQMGFDAYFLIVWDLCREARQKGIWYNARGSAAGSMVAYTLDITMVEPIGQQLLFERFLNPGRISMPDIDLDFQDDQRPYMMEYCARKYGEDKVSQIITFGTMGARGAIRDVGRVMDIPLSEVDRIAKLIPSIPSQPMRLSEVAKEVPEFKAACDEAEYLRDLVDTAAHMEGVVRNAGTHAAGVIITDKPLIEYAPLHRPTSGSEESPIKMVAQFEMSIVEAMGLLKVDFLGLATLTVMQRACDLIEKRHGIRLDLHTIPLDDAETYDFLGRGHTAGVFQLEGTGMTRNLIQMKPKNLANIIAMVALFRPGPMDFIPQYIRRMHNEEPVTYRHPKMEEYFKDTYGIPIYQEQLMLAAMGMAGYTASEADELRKAISKKNAEALAKHRKKFIEGCKNREIKEETAAGIFDDWENFARYGFNKSHAADYGVIAVETAYLKHHYAAEYMTALMSVTMTETEKIAFYVADCRSMGIEVLPPDVSYSEWDFSIEDHKDGASAIRFGLGAIKNVGLASVEQIIEARKDGEFKDLNDFVRRVDLRQVGKKSLECLIRVGAMDSFGNRKSLLEAMDRLVAVSTSHFKSVESGQMSFFGNIVGVEEDIRLPSNGSLDTREQLEWERELIGLYVSDHPLSPYLPVLKNKITHFAGQLGEAADKEKVVVAGLVTRFRNIRTKNDKEMGFATIEDIQGNIELVLFPKVWEKFNNIIHMDAVISVEGKVDLMTGDPKVLVDRIMLERPVDPATLPAEPVRQQPVAAKPVNKAVVPSVANNLSVPDFNDDIPEPPEEDNWTPRDDISFAPKIVSEVVVEEENQPVEIVATPQEEIGTGLQVVEPTLVPTETLPAFPIRYLYTPPSIAGSVAEGRSDDQRMVTVVMRGSGYKDQDVRRVTRVLGLLRSYPGKDRFALFVFENGHNYLLEFPNDTTGIHQELLRKLSDMVGEENVRVEIIPVQ
jgi:DNA polymerase-3 subunit alpha